MMRRLLLAALAMVVAVSVPGPGGAAAQEPADPPPVCPGLDYCLGDEAPLPGTDPTGPDGTPAAPGGGGPDCTTQPFAVEVGGGDYGAGLPNDPGPRPSPEAVLMYTQCEGDTTGRVWWWQPGEPAAPPRLTVDELAARARARVEGMLPEPQVVTSPAPGVAALLGVPSFVAVEGWGDTFGDAACDPADPGFCVSVTAVPSALSWWPGEPGTGAVACADGGTVFDPDGADLADQAAPPACAHAYRTRTGVWGRPAAWPGTVSVTWAVTYTAPSGAGTLPDVVKSASLPRAVDEVQSVVERAG